MNKVTPWFRPKHVALPVIVTELHPVTVTKYAQSPRATPAPSFDVVPNQEPPDRESSGTMLDSNANRFRSFYDQVIQVLRKYMTFIGPGFMIAVAYIDPGNYSTDVAA